MLPHNRQLKKLGELCKIRTGKKDANYATADGLYPFFTCGKEILKAPNYSFDTEAILIAGNGDVGACKYYKGKFEAYQRTYVVDGFDSSIDINYIFHVLNGRLKVHAIKESLGSAIPYIKLGTLQNFKIPLPPLEEQKKIVAYLDELNATITKLKSEYQAQLTALDEIRNSSLDLAFGGSRERERAYNLNNWKWVKLGEVLLFIRNGKSCIQNKDGIGSKVTRIETIAAGFIDENRVGYFDISKEDQEKYEIKKGDILFSHINSPSHIGKVAIAQKDYTDLFHGMNLLLIRGNAKINANFLYILLSRFFLRGTRSKLCKKAINQASLNQKNIIDLQIPLLSLEEQKQIVTYLDQVHSHISTLKDQVNTQITRCDELWQSSLKKILQSGISEMKEQE